MTNTAQDVTCPKCGSTAVDEHEDRFRCASCAAIFTSDYHEWKEGRNQKVEGVKPSTIVQMGKITIDQLEADVQKARTENSETISKFHEIWYNASFTWPYTHFLGVGMMKCPNDLWMYQAIMSRLRPKTIIETGTYQGGSALWFAYLMDMLGIADGKVFTIDFEAYDLDPIVRHPRITYLHGNSVDQSLVASLAEEIAQDAPLLICLDSDHSEKHVKAELDLYAPLCKVGDWLVVEDTNVGWVDDSHKLTFGGDLGKCSCGLAFMVMENAKGRVNLDKVRCPNDRTDLGARGGLTEYLEQHPGEWRQDILSERYLLTMNPGGWLQRVGECNHV